MISSCISALLDNFLMNPKLFYIYCLVFIQAHDRFCVILLLQSGYIMLFNSQVLVQIHTARLMIRRHEICRRDYFLCFNSELNCRCAEKCGLTCQLTCNSALDQTRKGLLSARGGRKPLLEQLQTPSKPRPGSRRCSSATWSHITTIFNDGSVNGESQLMSVRVPR